MFSKLKKALKITGISLLIIIGLLAAIPLLFEDQIKDMVKTFINNNVNANVEFSDVNLSFLASFPQANVTITDLTITNFEPFKGDTLTTAKSIAFDMSIKELFKKSADESILVNAIAIDEAVVNLKTNKKGETNYDISKKNFTKTNKKNSETDSNFSFDIDQYSITNSSFYYLDETSKTTIYFTELNHSGSANISSELSELNTTTQTNVSFGIDSTMYLKNTAIKLDALIDMDLSSNTYTFKNNKGFINQLPLEFSGFVQILDNGQMIDINFENPESSFKDFLAVVPETYSKNLDDVKTSGDFKVKGVIKGLVSEHTIPKLEINVVSQNASFKYPDLPKQVENININASIKNNSGNADDTYIAVNTLDFKIDDDVFKSSATLKNITKNMFINANIDGVLNLANITKAYPIKLNNELSGILKAKLNTVFDMKAIETNAYTRIKNKGSVQLTDFIFSSEDIVNPIHVSKADIQFNTTTITLKSFDAKTGNSDLNATGTIKNLLGFLLSDNTLQGSFNVKSNTFAVSDFMIENETTSTNNKTTADAESLKIPKFLDCTINANANTVLYDNLTLKNVKGKVTIQNEKATLTNVTSNIFDGNMTINGNVNTTQATPSFDMNLDASDFDISQSFNDLELFQYLAPIAEALQGKLNTTLKLSGNLDKEFAPDLSSVSGNAFTELLTASLKPTNPEILNTLEGALNFVDFNKFDLKDIKTKLEFANGKVSIKPFNLKYEDIDIEVSGSHGFDKTLAHSAVFNIPAKYLGNDVNQLITNINDDAVGDIVVPVTANITGTYTKPNVKTDLSGSVSKLTKQLVEIQKQKLLNTGKDKINDLLGDIISGNPSETKTDSTQQNDSVKDVFGGIIGGNTNNTDSTNTQPNTTVKDVLGGLFSGNKKKKDTVN